RAQLGGPDILCRLEDPVANLFWRLDRGMDRVDHTDEDPVIGLGVLLDDPEDPGPVALAGQLDVEASDREPEQCREELPVVHVSAVSRILVAPRARVNPDPRP